VQTALPNGGKGIVCEATGHPVGALVEFALERARKSSALAEVAHRCRPRPFVRPSGGRIDQSGKGDMPTTGGEQDVARASTVPDRHGETEFPGAPIHRAISLV